MKEIKPSVQKTKNAFAEGFSTLGGFLFANFAMTLAEKFAPAQFAKFSPVLGAAGFVPHYMNLGDTQKADNLRAFGNGMIAAGGTEALKKVTNGRTGILATLNSALPGRGSFAPIAGFRGLGAGDMDAMLLSGGYPSGNPMMLLDDASLVN